MSFSETFDFITIFYVGYAVYLSVASLVTILWIVLTRRYRRLNTEPDYDPWTGSIGKILKVHYRLVFTIVRLGKTPVHLPSQGPSYKQIFTLAGATGVTLATVSGIIVVSIQWFESLS